MSADADLWYVKLADGDVHRVTLEQLDDAFQAGRIDANVMVLGAGETEWAKLADLIGGDEPAPAAPVAAPMVAAAVPVRVPAQYAQPAPQYAQPTPQYAQVVPSASSLRPMSLDLSDDFGGAPFRRSSGKRWVVGLIGAAAALGGVVFATTRTTGSADGAPVTAAAAIEAPPIVAPDPAPPAPVAVPAASSDMYAIHLSDAQKQKLLDADKEREQTAKTHNKKTGGVSHSGGGTSAKASKSSQPFTTGGNKYDPLNSTL